MQTHRGSAASNARWAAVSQGGRVSIQLIGLLIFSRLLNPTDFGLLAMATVVTNFAVLFRDMGMSAAVVQRLELTEQFLDTVFFSNLIFGIFVGVVIAATSPVVAWIFSAPPLKNILLTLSVTFPLSSLGALQMALLERFGRFRDAARIEIGSAVTGLIVGIVAAILEAGIYSLVLQMIATAVCSTAQLWIGADWRPSRRWSRLEFRRLWQFSGNLLAFNVINYFVRNGDSMLIGRFLGTISLGWYSVANRILLFPLQNITFVISRAMLPVYSRYQENSQKMADYYLKTLSIITAISAPLMVGLWVLRAPFVIVALGDKWLPVADLLAWFAPMGILQSLTSTTGTILSAKGRTDLLRSLGLFNTAVIVSGFVIGLQYGLVSVAIAYFFATLLVTFVSLKITLSQVNLSLLALGRGIVMPIGCAVLMGVILFVVENALSFNFSAVTKLVILAPLGMMSYASLLLMSARPLMADLMYVFWRKPVN